MAKQLAAKREDKKEEKTSSAKPGSKVAGTFSLRKSPERRSTDHGHAGQLLWSFTVALVLILAALLQWTAPKNALMEQDRAPAQIRFETMNTSLNGS